MTILQMGLTAFAVVSAVGSQLIFKHWVNSVGSLPLSAEGVGRLFVKILGSPLMLTGLVLYGLGFLAWILLLSRTSLSLVYPVVISLNILLILSLSAVFFRESIYPLQILGIFFVLLGIFLVFKI